MQVALHNHNEPYRYEDPCWLLCVPSLWMTLRFALMLTYFQHPSISWDNKSCSWSPSFFSLHPPIVCLALLGYRDIIFASSVVKFRSINHKTPMKKISMVYICSLHYCSVIKMQISFKHTASVKGTVAILFIIVNLFKFWPTYTNVNIGHKKLWHSKKRK